jgi:DNA-binding HxlR family transcriptional regulator
MEQNVYSTTLKRVPFARSEKWQFLVLSNLILKPEYFNEIYKSVKFMTSLIVCCLSSVRL